MKVLRRLLKPALGEVPLRKEERFIEGPSLLVALRGLKPVGDIKGSLRAKLRLLKDLRRSTL
jgi:hypothetical protein